MSISTFSCSNKYIKFKRNFIIICIMVDLIVVKGKNSQTDEILYYPKWTRRDTDTADELAEEMAGSSFSEGEIVGVMKDFPKRIARSLKNGNAAKIKGLGTFKLKVSGKSKIKKEDVNAVGCKAQIVFDVDPKLLTLLDGISYKIVEHPTKEGEQDVEDTSTGTIDTSTGTVDSSTGTADPSTNNTPGENAEP